jgi:hypothetical protein
MRKIWMVGLSALALSCFAPAVSHADSTKVPVKGLLKSGSASGTPSTSATVINNADEPSTSVGSGQVFVVTQACFAVTGSTGVVTVQAGTSYVASFFQSNNNAGSCVSLTPGYIVPEGTDVTCAGNASATTWTCSISGVVAKKK